MDNDDVRDSSFRTKSRPVKSSGIEALRDNGQVRLELPEPLVPTRTLASERSRRFAEPTGGPRRARFYWNSLQHQFLHLFRASRPGRDRSLNLVSGSFELSSRLSPQLLTSTPRRAIHRANKGEFHFELISGQGCASTRRSLSKLAALKLRFVPSA